MTQENQMSTEQTSEKADRKRGFTPEQYADAVGLVMDGLAVALGATRRVKPKKAKPKKAKPKKAKPKKAKPKKAKPAMSYRDLAGVERMAKTIQNRLVVAALTELGTPAQRATDRIIKKFGLSNDHFRGDMNGGICRIIDEEIRKG